MSAARTLLVACAALLPLLAGAAGDPPTTPLLTLARQEQKRKTSRHLRHLRLPGTADLRTLELEIERAHPPPGPECAQSLGASHFSGKYQTLGEGRFDAGDLEGAAAAFRNARDCSPRNASLYSRLADVSFAARDFAGARASAEAGLVLDPRSIELAMVSGQLAFAEERWADAIVRFRYVAAGVFDRTAADYAQLLLWLSQRRAGVPSPQFVARTHDDDWPRPLVLYMSGRNSEADLVEPIKGGIDDDEWQANTRVRLCEALFYVGESTLARGDPALAREYFIAAASIKGTRLIEHTLALAELAKLRTP